MGLPEVRYPDGTEIAPHLDMRREFGLYRRRPAGAQACRTRRRRCAYPRAERDRPRHRPRDRPRGCSVSRGKGTVEDDRMARDTLVITRATSARSSSTSAFRLAERRKARGADSAGKVTCVDKANVFVSMAFFRKIFDERAPAVPRHRSRALPTSMPLALDLIRRPWDFDVMVMENMFGDILSDLGGGTRRWHGHGAMRRDRRLEHGLFQPATAPPPTLPDRARPTPRRCCSRPR